MITLSMIVKNEEKYLADCLASVKDVVDEIILVDTGSTDRTIEIAKDYDAKIFNFNWVNDFSAARNYALDNSTGDWVLYLDADERLSPDSKAELRRLTKEIKKEAYFCIVDNIDEIGHRAALMAYPRLFPNKKELRFEGAIHEQIEPALLRNHYQIKNAKIKIIHLGYNVEKDEMDLKAKRNLEILMAEYQRTKSFYYAYQLGQTYGLLNKPEEAVFYFEECLKDTNLNKDFISTAYRYIAVDSAKKKDYKKAIELINKSLAADAEQPLALLAASSIYSLAKDFEKADSYCRQAYRVNNQLISQKKYSSQIPLSDDKSILYHGLSIAIQARDKNLFNYYSGLINNSKTIKGLNDLQNLFSDLLNNKKINVTNLEKYVRVIDDSNINVLLSVLKDYQRIESKLNLLKNIYPKFFGNYTFLNNYGLFLSEAKFTDEAELIFEKSYKLNPYEPSTIFYLISSYIQKNQKGKIIDIIKEAEYRVKELPEISNQIERLKAKLHDFISD
ncbi:MAG: glycosyltransferase [Ignavibacteriaceae bacterium]